MALINCPECNKSISDKTYKCPNCGVVINKPKSSVTGVIFKSMFVIFNAIMIFIIILSIVKAPGAISIATYGVLFGIWVIIGLPLALMSYLTRPKAY